MSRPLGIALAFVIALGALLGARPGMAAGPEGTLTVAVATFGNERWLPNLYVGAEDVVLKPMYENLLTRDPKTGELAPMLAERWQVLDGGRTWKFHLRKGVRFHNGAEMTAEDVRFTFATIAKEGSANSLAPEFRQIKSMEVENPHTLTVHFEKPFVVFGNKVNQGLFASCAFIQSKKHVETAGEQGVATASSTRRWTSTGGPRPTGSGSSSPRCRNRPPAWPCCGPARWTSSRSAASTSTSCGRSTCARC
jgi:ABC-type transport system substrate-binding protein